MGLSPKAENSPVPSGTGLDLSRANLYGVLSALYDRPLTAEFREELHLIGILRMLSAACPEFSADGLMAADLDSLNAEYTRLFVGPGPHVAPFASVYRQDDLRTGELWGNTTGEVKRFMEYYGLAIKRGGVIPDHISILLEFMERTIRAGIDSSETNSPAIKRSDARQTARKIQNQFFTGYIDPWVESFLGRVKSAKPSSFYLALVQLTRQFMTWEKQELSA